MIRPPSLRPSAAAALLVAAAFAFSLSSCGGGSGDAAGVLKQTFGPHPPVHSYNLGLSVGIDVKGVKSLAAPLTLRLAGPYVNTGPGQLPRFNLGIAVTGSGQAFAATATTTATQAFITIAGTPYVLPDALFQQFRNGYAASSAQSGKKSTGFTALGLSPSNWLVSPQRLANVRVGDAQTIHIRSGVNVPRLLQDVSKLLGRASAVGISVPSAPRTITPQQQAAIAHAVKTATVDVYTGATDKVLRRLLVTVTLAVAPQSRSLVGGLQSGTIFVDYSRTNLNNPSPITAPANPHPLAQLLSSISGSRAGSALGGLAGSSPSSPSSGSGSGSSPGAGAATGAGGSAAPQAYINCLSAAKGDIAKIQACQPLLSGG